MNILITGGAGYLGSVLVGKLLGAETTDRVVVYDNLMYHQVCLTEHAYRKNFEFVLGDVRDTKKLLPYIKQADIIIPLAAIVGFPACDKDPRLAFDVNFSQIQLIAKHATSAQRIVYPNTNSGYGVGEGETFCTEETPMRPISIYGRTKADAERLLLDSGRAITLRLATVFGVSPRMRMDLLVNDFTYRAVTDGYLVLFEPNFRRNFIHVRDIASTFMFMIEHYDTLVGQTFNVGLSDANISKKELAERIKKFVPKLSVQVDDFATDPDKRDYIVSNAKLEATGWRPQFSLDDGIQELIVAYRIIRHNAQQHYTNL